MSAMLPAPLSAWVEEPLHPALENGSPYNGPIMLLGMYSGGSWFGIGDDGHIRFVDSVHITVDWRYDWKQHEWIEVNGIAEELENDGGADLQGSIYDADGGSGGDSISEEGGPTTGDPGSVEATEEGVGEDR